MKFIALIQQYWAINNALRVLRALEFNYLSDEDLIFTADAAIPQLEAAATKLDAELVGLPNNDRRNVFSDAEPGMQLSPQVNAIIDNLNKFEKFRDHYAPIYKIYWKFVEFIQTENKLIVDCDNLVKLKSQMTDILRHYFLMQEPIDDDTNERVLSKHSSRRISGYVELLGDYDRVYSPLRLMVAEGLALQNGADVADWLHTHIFTNTFMTYFDAQLKTWSGHYLKWNELLLKINQLQEKLELTQPQKVVLAEFEEGVRAAFQRFPKYGLFCKELTGIFADAASSPAVMRQVKEISIYLQKSGEFANEAIGESNAFEALLADLKKLQTEIDKQLENYPKVSRFGFEYESAGQKYVKRTLRNGLLAVLTVVADTYAQISKNKALHLDESDILECKLLREDVCNDLRVAFHQFERNLEKDNYILDKVKDEALNKKLKPEIEKFFKQCGISFEIIESLEDHPRLDQ